MAIDKEKTLQAAHRAMERKKYDLAIEEYRRLALAEKNDPRWLLKIGDIQAKKGDYAAAFATYDEVARFYSTQGFLVKAQAVYNSMREQLAKQPSTLQAKYAHVPVRLAELYEKLQLTSDAIALWDGIADRHLRDGREREAADVLRRIVALDPNNPLAHVRLAELLVRLREIDEAIKEFAATAELLIAQSRIDEAIKVYERLLHNRQEPRHARAAAELYLQRNGPGDGVSAIAKTQICLKADPRSVESFILLARGFASHGSPDKAIAIYKEAARLAGEQNRNELRADIAKRLSGLAPNDEQVRALIADVQGRRDGSRKAEVQTSVDPTNASTAARRTAANSVASARQTAPTTAAAVATNASASQHVPAPITPAVGVSAATRLTTASTAGTTTNSVPQAPQTATAAVTTTSISQKASIPAAPATSIKATTVADTSSAQKGRTAAPSMGAGYVAATTGASVSMPAPATTAGSASAAPTAANTASRGTPHLQQATSPATTSDIEELELTEIEEEVSVDSRRAAEEVQEASLASARARAARVTEVIGNADAFRRVKLYAKALTTLRIGLELEPRSVPLRERIRDILIETSETDLAIGEMITLSAILLEDGDLQGAYDNLAWILEADPEHPQALKLMEQLQIAAGNIPAPEHEVVVDADVPPTGTRSQTAVEPDELDVPAPLDAQPEVQSKRRALALDRLDEVGTEDALPSYAGPADEPDKYSGPLPAYELDEHTNGTGAWARIAASGSAVPPTPSAAPAPESRSATQTATQHEVEAIVEEADFYASQGVFETARETIEEALKTWPHHPLLLHKLAEIQETRQRLSSLPPVAVERDTAFEIAESLDALDAGPAPSPASVDQIDVDEVFAKFKLGVAEQVDANDSATHYDLGIAYDQMALYNDAVQEFRIASRDPARHALCQSMIGVIYEKLGMLTEAIDAYKLGLASPQLTHDEELALLYSLAGAYEARRNKREAIASLRRVVAIDPRYRNGDAKARLQALEAPTAGGSGTRRRDDIDAELDAAFDEVLGERRKD